MSNYDLELVNLLVELLLHEDEEVKVEEQARYEEPL
jgi:hypothetical protein